MSQFLLAKSVNVSGLPEWIRMVSVNQNECLKNAASKIFGEDSASCVFTVALENDDFDGLLVKARTQISDGATYENTRLYELLAALTASAERVALWYGDDYHDLEVTSDPNEFALIVLGMSSPSVEVYVMYLKPG